MTPYDTPVRSQADLYQLWHTLMGEPGFATPQLWIVLLDADDRCTPLIQKVTDLPDVPDPEHLSGLMHVCGSLVDEAVPEGSVAFLRARPGPAGLTTSDRAWAMGLTAAAQAAGVPCRPVHLANDHEIRVFAPDDAAATA